MKKLAGQIIAATILVVFADIRITNLYGFLDIGQLPYIISLLLTVFVFIVIINGFNLIDGIDGLASGAEIVTSLVFALWFWYKGDIPLYDSMRVFILRISRGQSPFKADRQHLHHRLLQLGYSHLKSTLILLSVNVAFIIFCFAFQGIGIVKLTFIMAVTATILSTVLVNLARKRSKKLTELELQLADSLKKLYRRRDGMIRKANMIDVPGSQHATISKN